jgi:hypothetical protein
MADAIRITSPEHRVTGTVTATDYPRVGIPWVEMDNNFSLQNLLTGLFGEFRVQADN